MCEVRAHKTLTDRGIHRNWIDVKIVQWRDFRRIIAVFFLWITKKKHASLFFFVFRIFHSYSLFLQHEGINILIHMFHRRSKYMLTMRHSKFGCFFPFSRQMPHIHICVWVTLSRASDVLVKRFHNIYFHENTIHFLLIFIFSHNLNYFSSAFSRVQFSHRRASAITYISNMCNVYPFRIQAYFCRFVDADPFAAAAVVIIVAMAAFFFVRYHFIICLSRGISFNCYLHPNIHTSQTILNIYCAVCMFVYVCVLSLRQSVIWICVRENPMLAVIRPRRAFVRVK